MYFVNNLTDDDFQRVHDTCSNPPPAMLMAESFAALLEAIDIYTYEAVHPVTSGPAMGPSGLAGASRLSAAETRKS